GVKTAWAAATCNTIADCTNQISQNKAAVNDLQNQALSYQDAVTRLQSQINTVQAQINANQVEQSRLEKEIAAAQAQIDYQKAVLGTDLRTMYIEGHMSTIEALATSNDLSEYVDKEEYRNAVQKSIQNTLDKISKLQAQLHAQREQVARLLAEQRSQAAQLASDRAQQASLLAMNRSQQAAYNAQTAQNQSKLNALIAAQRAANSAGGAGTYAFVRVPGPVRDFSPEAYPYANAGFSMSTAPGCNDNDGPDRWGYCTRQCVSYAAWAVEASGREAPRYWGNAKNWDNRATAAGIPVYNYPQVGDVAVSNKGTWGHVMYVEAVSGDRMYVSQYNQQLTGRLSYQWIDWR
ncbi:MAG TPA: CHAP domain-containing protein, partial [Candidatus Saccharimonadales bacterium]